MAILPEKSVELLNDLFLELEAQPDGVNAVRFRAKHDRRISEIETLVSSGWVEQQDRFYFLRLPALVELAGVNPKAESLLYLCRHIFDHLRALYKQDPERKISIAELATVVEMPIGRVRKAIPYFRRGIVFFGASGDMNSPEGSIVLSEQLLRYASFEGVIEQYRQWAETATRSSKQFREPSGDMMRAYGTTPAIRDRTNAAIVIGIAAEGMTTDKKPSEILDAEHIQEWLTSEVGGQVPSRSTCLITSTIEAGGTVIAPRASEVEKAFTELYIRRSEGAYAPSLVTSRLYIFVTGPGYVDHIGRTTLLTANESNELVVGIELTNIANRFRDYRLFDEVIMFVDVARLSDYERASLDIRFESRAARETVQPADYCYVLAARRDGDAAGASLGAGQGFHRDVSLARWIIEGLDGLASDRVGNVTFKSFSDYLMQKYSSDPALYGSLPVIQMSGDGSTIISRKIAKFSSSQMKSIDETEEVSKVDPITQRKIGGRLNVSREANEDELCLSVDDYAAAIATLFSNADAKEFCFALFGHWGRGKTFLMQRVGKSLSGLKAGYKTITFSAWKYPSAPEVWVHLYEEIAKAAFQDPWYRRVPNVVRTGIAKSGGTKLLLAYAALAWSVISFVQLFLWGEDLLRLVYPILGVSGFIWIWVFVRGVKETKSRLSKTYLTASRHAEKLGLQATIGSDLCALLKGWIPKEQFFGKAFVAVYWLITAGLVAASLLRILGGRDIEQWMQTRFQVELIIQVNPYLAVGFSMLLVVLSGLLIWWLRYGGASPTKVLLVVDDLDRCKPEHLLSVMESIKLLIEDPEISSRIQVAMLLEEDVLKHAILEKYKGLADNQPVPMFKTGHSSETLIWENGEKLFTAHLRLPQLAKAEVRELVEAFSGRRNDLRMKKMKQEERRKTIQEKLARRPEERIQTGVEVREIPTGPMVRGEQHTFRRIEEPIYRLASAGEIEEQRVQMAKEADVLERELAELSGAGENGAVTNDRIPQEVEISRDRVLEESEIDSVICALDSSNLVRRNLGPRAIRAFLFRYQLARLLLDKLGIPWDTVQLAQSLASRSFDSATSAVALPIDSDLTDEQKFLRIVDQVC